MVKQQELIPEAIADTIEQQREQVRKIVLSHNPHLNGKGLYITLEIDSLLMDVLLPTGRQVKNNNKQLLMKEYTSIYSTPISEKLFCEVLREIKAELVKRSVSVEGQEERERIEGEVSSFLDTSTDKVYKVSKDTPIAIGHIPHVLRVLRNYDETDKPEVTYEVKINGVVYLIPHQKLIRGTYSDLLSDTSGLANKFNRDTYSNAIFHTAKKAPQVTSVRGTGFYSYHVAGKELWTYILPTGKAVTYNDKPVSSLALTSSHSSTSGELWDKFERKQATTTPEDITEAYQYLKGLTPNGLSLILTANFARSIAYEIRTDTYKVGHAIHLYGAGGSGKTELSMYCRGLVKPYELKGSVDATYRDSLASSEPTINFNRHMPFIIDDLSRGERDTERDMRRKEDMLENISRSAYDNRPIRGRANPDMTPKYPYTVRTLPVSTGEYFPSGMNITTFRRLLTIGVVPQDIHIKASPSYQHCLEHYKKHVYSHYALGRKLQKMLVYELCKYGREAVSVKYEEVYHSYESVIEKRLISLWNERQYIPLPHDAINPIGICSQILLGGYLLDLASKGATSFVEDMLTPLVEVLYNHLCLSHKLSPDKTMLTPLGEAFTSMLVRISSNRPFRLPDGTSEYLRLSDYHENTYPVLIYESGRVFTDTMCGYGMSEIQKSKVAMYFKMSKDTSPKRLFLTDIGLEALLTLMLSQEGYEHLTPITLKKLLEQENWLVNKEAGRNLSVQIYPLGTRDRAVELNLSLFLQVTDTPLSEEDVFSERELVTTSGKRGSTSQINAILEDSLQC